MDTQSFTYENRRDRKEFTCMNKKKIFLPKNMSSQTYSDNLMSNMVAVILGLLVLFLGASLFYNQYNCKGNNFLNKTSTYFYEKGKSILFWVALFGALMVLFDMFYPAFSESHSFRAQFGLTKCVAIAMSMMILAYATLGTIADASEDCKFDNETVRENSTILNSVICAMGVYILFKAATTQSVHMKVFDLGSKNSSSAA